MEQLETTKGKSVVIPKIVNRYILLYYDLNMGWTQDYQIWVNPESAIQYFMEKQNKYPNKNIKYYKVIEVELEIPFVPKKGTISS